MDLIDEGPQGNAPEFTVSDLSGAVKRVVEGAFDHVRVRGEIGRVSRPRSGHLYLDLKDDRAVLASVCWKGVAGRLEVQPEEGMEVVATGRLTTFAGQSRYQLVIESLAPAGVGALMAMLEKRRKALAAEGLFDPARKRPLPFAPRVVGVVTSPSGAVIRDILHRLGERFPTPVLVWPVAVQGKACAGEVAKAIRGFNALAPGGAIPRPDVLIVARGGGSVEDLWGFNEEEVVRAAAASEIPLISAVGHETDTTLIDHAADRRAPTPTAAAEIAAPVRGELLAQIAGLDERRERAAARALEERGRRLRDLARAMPRIGDLLAERRQRLDLAALRLPQALSAMVATRRVRLTSGLVGAFSPQVLARAVAERRAVVQGLAARLRPSAARGVERAGDRLNGLNAEARLGRARDAALSGAAERLSALGRLLEGYSYRGALARGFAVVRDEAGELVTSAAAARRKPVLEIEFADGRAQTGGKPARRGGKTGPEDAQGALDL